MLKQTCFLFVFLLFSTTVPVRAADKHTIGSLSSLHAVKRFDVVIESLNNDVLHDGLTVDELQTDVELRLRQSGLPVSEKSGSSQPYLYVRVSTIKVEDRDLYSFGIEVIFQQPVNLVSNPKTKFIAGTWETGSIGFVSKNNVQAIRHFVADDIDRFISQ